VVDEDAVALFHLIAEEVARLVVADPVPAGGLIRRLEQVVEREYAGLGLRSQWRINCSLARPLGCGGERQPFSFCHCSSSSTVKVRYQARRGRTFRRPSTKIVGVLSTPAAIPSRGSSPPADRVGWDLRPRGLISTLVMCAVPAQVAASSESSS